MPSPCDNAHITYDREVCAQSLYYPINSRKLLDLPRRAADVVLADRELASLKYTPINPTFGPPQSYLNFEVAIEKSDSGIIYVYIPLFLITKKNVFKHFQCVNYCVRSYVLLFPNIFNFGSYFFK